MKIWFITVPLGLAMMCIGGWLALASRPHFKGIADEIPRHKISDQMVLAAEQAEGKVAPDLLLQPVNGSSIQLSQAWSKQPVFIYFILKGCPCSIESEPFFEAIEDGFGHKIPFIAVTNADETSAKEWVKHYGVTYPVVSDPSLKVMKAFGAKESTYSVLVKPGGIIDREWPGYDQAILQNIEDRISLISKLEYPDLDFHQAPLKPTSGCFFGF